MYTATLPTLRPMPFAAPIGAAATAACALLGSALAVSGTGSVFDISRAGDWRRMLEARVPLHVDVGVADDSQEQRPDLRSASEHLGNIRQIHAHQELSPELHLRNVGLTIKRTKADSAIQAPVAIHKIGIKGRIGPALIERAVASHVANQHRLIAGLPPETRDQLDAGLRAWLALLDARDPGAKG